MTRSTLFNISEKNRDEAHRKYKIIEPFLNKTDFIHSISAKSGIPMRTLNLWLKKYRDHGLQGLARKNRKDKGISRSYDVDMKKRIEGMWLNNPEIIEKSPYINF